MSSSQKHLRETRRQILLPFALALLVIVVCAVLVMSPLFPPPDGRYQVSIVSNVMLMVFMLCPAVICFGTLAVGMVLAVFAMNKGHMALAKPLRQVEELSETLEQRTIETTTKINRRAINLSSRFAIFDKWLSVFERPKLRGNNKK